MTLRELIIRDIRNDDFLQDEESDDTWCCFWLKEYDDQRPCWQHVQTTRENAQQAYQAALESLSDEELYLLNRRIERENDPRL